ncbi:J domain-containing protein [Runella slithyformis]|uniref:Heat shock protein DnaJ domain protein n=1 Tax=Runella slithyformis (strain ATCC 29530 / DSM 19594 / LMG 11500 / NCIMB 11436 / LSU 4) TaxID=761193 RepID=A0A7U4E589_RUNSL|nr:J domain-containing protein [Runella slithyformis]AEI48213.1 heat shock protein DnaJ domain protein [Runella slithyformis DSM 19594]
MAAKIVRITKAKAEQNKAQKEFNRLVQKIETLGKTISDYRAALTDIQQRAATELEPLRQQYFAQRAQLLNRFDRAFDSSFYKKNEKKKLAYLIQDIAFELISAAGMEELKPIFDKYNQEGGYDAVKENVEGMNKSFSTFEEGFEEEFDLGNQEKTPHSFQEDTTEYREFAGHRQSKENRTQRPKTQKQLDREAKRELEARNSTKAVRTIYLDLVKAFHPDRETDEAEKDRKTEIMQRVTEAYEKNDVLTLLRLQLELERIDQSHIESLAEAHLNYYNKILREQTKELEEQYEQLQFQALALGGQSAYLVSNPFGLEYAFNQQVNEFKKTVKNLKKDLKDLQYDEVVKTFLKSYIIPDQNDEFGFVY